MGKTIRSNNIQTKKYSKKRKKTTSEATKDHTEEYAKKHEKGKYPRRVWPTESENSNHKGPKI